MITANYCDKGHTYLQWLMAILANSAVVTYGLQTGWVSPMTKVLQSDSSPTGTPLSDSEISWLASAVNLFAVIGVPFYTYIADAYGRKAGLLAISVPQALCWLIKVCSVNTYAILTARALAGLAAGGCFNVVAMYVKEISQDSIRGLLGSLLVLSQNIGFIIIFALGAYLDYFTVLWIVISLPFVTLLLIFKAPESPAFLIKIGKVDEATRVVAYLRGRDIDDKLVQDEIVVMKNEDYNFKSIPNMSFVTIFKEKAWRQGFLRVLAVITIRAWNGSLVVVTYAAPILSTSGITVNPELQSLSFPVVMILASILVMCVIERFGRKTILIAALVLVGASMFSIGTIILLQYQGSIVPGWLSVTALIGSVAGYAGGISPIPFVMMTEIFNFQIRAKFMGIIVTHAWFMSFVQFYAFGAISAALGQYTSFFIFGAINLLGIFVTLLLPETKGKSVEQIEAELRAK